MTDFESMLDTFAPKSSKVETELRGQKFVFDLVTSADGWDELTKDGREVYTQFKDRDPALFTDPKAKGQPFVAQTSPQVFAKAYAMSKICIEPELTVVEWCQFAFLAGITFNYLYQFMSNSQMGMEVVHFVEAKEAAKND